MSLILADAQSVADLSTYVHRALKLDGDGAIRLQASGTTLAAWVGVRKPRGLTGEGTVLGLRVMALVDPGEADAVVSLRAVADRLARISARGETTFDLPPVTVHTSWAGVTPPRAGWAPLGAIPAAVLRDAAVNGFEAIVKGTPENAGAAAVEQVRQRVWSTPIEGADGGSDGLPAGAALAMYTLGFLVEGDAQVFATARWHRVSTPIGHVLVR